jgi:OmpA-OmpF porin, OOP family
VIVRTCRRSWLGGLSLLLLSLSSSSVAEAAAPEGFAVNRFEPAERGSTWFVLDSLDIHGTTRPAAGLTLDYQHQPLAIYGPDDEVRTAIVKHVLTAHLGANITMWNRLRIGFNLPLVLYTDGDAGTVNGVRFDPPSSAQGIGDLRFGADARLFGEYGGPLTMAFGARLWLPTGSTGTYTGDGGARIGPRLSAAGQVGAFVYGANIGLAFRNPSAASFAGSPLDHDLVFGVSAGAALLENKLTIGPELYGTTGLGDATFKTRTTPLEILLGGHYAIGGASGIRVGAGIGTGLVAGFGSPGVRALGMVEWAPAAGPDEDGDGIPDSEDACRAVKGVRSADPAKNGCPVEALDTDGDGIPDSEDACMDVFGKRTNDKRTNGCDDRDRDGIMDPLDACPFEYGPPNADPKKNGCPDKVVGDKDHDGIPDDVDACPDVAGNKSEDPDLNGCPDPDPDKDGIPTDQDACPDVPGKPDPDPSKNGCPAAFIQGKQIRIKDQVKFKTNSAEILPGKESEDILLAVAELMKAHPEIKKVRVEGHTDSKGVPAANKKLSEQRAASVMKWLTSHGIEQVRLTSTGFGQEKPLDSNETEQGRATNRRVELHIEVQDEPQ